MTPSLFENPLHALLLKSLHQETSTDTLEHFRTLNETQWTDLTREAIRLRLPYALDQFLQRHPDIAGLMPENCRVRLKNRQRKTLLLNLKRQAQLRKMLDALDAEGIPYLLMKGLWIVEILYGNLAARNSGDIDLLFKPHDMPRFTRLAQRMGFALDTSIQDIRDLAPMGHEFPLSHPDIEVTFDIHWAMTHPVFERPVNDSGFWERSHDYPIAGRMCRSLQLEDHILLLSYHAAEHHRFQYVGPRALVDLAQAMHSSPRPIDWNLLVQRAETLGWMKGLALMLDMVRETTGITPPASIRTALQSHVPIQSEMKELALEALILDQNSHDAIGSKVLRLLEQQSLGHRIRYLYGRLFPSSEFIRQYFFLAPHQVKGRGHLLRLYLIRAGRLLKPNLTKLIQLLQGDPTRRAEIHRSARLQKWLDEEQP